MDWYYAVGGQRTGPVSDAQLEELVRSGKISRDTLVWRDGMAGWQPLHATRPEGASSISGAQSGIICTECGRTFPLNEVIKVNQSWVCAQCKPIFLQRLREGAAPSGAGIWRQGRRLVARSEAPFPDRCVKCNAPANGFRLKRVLYWAHPAYLLLLFCNLLILLIVYLIVRKQVILNIGLCEKHRARRKLGLIVGWTGTLVGFVLLIGAAVVESGLMALATVVLLLFSWIYGGIMASTLAVTRMNQDKVVWIRGAHRDFLGGLPEWPG